MTTEAQEGVLPSDVFFHRFNDRGGDSYRVTWVTTKSPSYILDKIRDSHLRLVGDSQPQDEEDELRSHGITPVRIRFKNYSEPRTFPLADFLNGTVFRNEVPNLDEVLDETIVVNRYAVYGLKTEHPGLPFRQVSILSLQDLANEVTLLYETTASQSRKNTTLDRMYFFLNKQLRGLDRDLGVA